MNREEQIKSYYSEWWENPRDPRNLVFDALNEYVRQRIPPGQRKKALDIGSGRGRIVSYLLEKGYQVTAVEFNPLFAQKLRQDFPTIRVIEADVCSVEYDEVNDLVTCIQVLPMIERQKLIPLLKRLSSVSRLFLTNISNRNSLHGGWVRVRGFRLPFLDESTPKQLDSFLSEAGFKITHRQGVGLLTPITLFSGFRGRFIPFWLARLANQLDGFAPEICHLYYVEAEGKAE